MSIARKREQHGLTSENLWACAAETQNVVNGWILYPETSSEDFRRREKNQEEATAADDAMKLY